MNNLHIGIRRNSQIFFALFFLAMCVSIGFTYYRIVVQEDFAVFTDPETVPNPADFFAYLVSAAEPYFQQEI